MKFLPKALVAAAGLVVAANALATVTTGNTGEFFLSVFDPNGNNGNGISYMRDLGLRIPNFDLAGTQRVTDGTTWALGSTPGNSLENGSVIGSDYDLTFSVDPLLGNLLGAAVDPSAIVWNVTALDTSAVTNPTRIFTTTNASQATVQTMTNATFNNALATGSVVRNYVSESNLLGTHPSTTAVNGSNTATSANGNAYWPASLSGNIGSFAPFNTTAGLDASLMFYELRAGAGSFVEAAKYADPLHLGTWLLNSDGVLMYSVAAVPEPGTYAMLAAGLIVLGAIARRRLQ